jgi:hypothetical protein
MVSPQSKLSVTWGPKLALRERLKRELILGFDPHAEANGTSRTWPYWQSGNKILKNGIKFSSIISKNYPNSTI